MEKQRNSVEAGVKFAVLTPCPSSLRKHWILVRTGKYLKYSTGLWYINVSSEVQRRINICSNDLALRKQQLQHLASSSPTGMLVYILF